MLLELCISVDQLIEFAKTHEHALIDMEISNSQHTDPVSGSTVTLTENVMSSHEKEIETYMTMGEENTSVSVYNWEILSGRLLSDETADWKVMLTYAIIFRHIFNYYIDLHFKLLILCIDMDG